MAFSKKTWVDRVADNLAGRTLTDDDTGTVTNVTVSLNEGEVYVEGDELSAYNLNDLEDRIDNAFSELPPVDTSMSDSSTNPVQNNVIKAYVDEHSGGSDVVVTPVLTTGTTIATISVDGVSVDIKETDYSDALILDVTSVGV